MDSVYEPFFPQRTKTLGNGVAEVAVSVLKVVEAETGRRVKDFALSMGSDDFHISFALDACRTATVPRSRSITAPDWWRKIILFTAMVGIRRNDLLDATMDWIVDDTLIVPKDHSKKRTETEVYPLPIAAMQPFSQAGR